jgi:hypothetical protein
MRPMVAKLSRDAQALLSPVRLFGWSELVGEKALLPRRPGVYAWYFVEVPHDVPHTSCARCGDAMLLYVGIAPKKPPAAGAPSRATLRSRILGQHFGGNASSSTLRLTLGCLLGETLRMPNAFRYEAAAHVRR